MKLNRSILGGIAFALLAAPLSLMAQGTITGQVRRENPGAPVPFAIIRLVGTTIGTAADSLGRFTLREVPGGVHDLEARAVGHTTATVRVTVTAGVETRTELRLAAAPTELAGIRVVGGTSDALDRFPGSAIAIGSARLEAQQPLSANDVLRTVAGVHVQDEEGAGLRANIGIRGLDPDRSRSLLVLEDGIPVALAPYGEPELYYSPPIDRMARVEVIKGSGSILFGPQTIGGVVNYVTAEPVTGFGGRVEARGGSGGQQFAKLAVGGSRGAARGLVSAFERRARDFNGLDYLVRDVTLKGGVRTPVGDLSAKVSLYDESSNATYVGLTDSMYRAEPYRHPMPGDRLAIGRRAASVAHEIALGPATTLRTTAYAYHTARDWTRRDYTYSSGGARILAGIGTGSRDRAFDVGGIEPRLTTVWSIGGIGSALDVGARYHVERARDRYLLGSVTTTATTVRDDEVRRGNAVSAWAQNRIALHPTLELTPGIRWERFAFERRITRGRVRRTDGTTTTRSVEALDIRSGDAVSEVIPGIGAAWTPRPLLTVFAGAHRGFAPPRTKDALIYGDPTLAPDAQVPDPVSLQLDAERSWNYELGARVAPRPWLALEATLFLLDFTNQIIEPSLSAGSVSVAALANQGATRHEGVELGGSVDLGKLWSRPWSLAVEGNWTLVDARFSRDRFLRVGADTVNVKGNALPYAPRQRAHAAVTFERPALGLRVRIDGTQVGRQYSDLLETVAGSANGRVGAIPAYGLVDLSVQYALPGLDGVRLTGAVRNLTDRTYIASRRPEGIKVGLPRLATFGVSWGF